MTRHIPDELRAQVIQRAHHRCEYYRLPESVSRIFFEIDHIIAIKHGGRTVKTNLAYACAYCNRHKGPNLTTILGDDDTPIRIFNPRKDIWHEHFEALAGMIYGKTPIGEATVKLLNLNIIERVIGRQILQEAGLYP